MRDNSHDMLELIDALMIEGLYYVVIKVTKNKISEKYRFGVSEKSYGALKQILQTRPFDSMPGLKHQYYFNRSGSRNSLNIRIEVQNKGKVFSFDAPNDLVRNMFWFFELVDLSEAAYLRLTD